MENFKPKTFQLISDLSEVQDMVDRLTNECKETEYELFIERGDDLPHAITVKTELANSIAEELEEWENFESDKDDFFDEEIEEEELGDI